MSNSDENNNMNSENNIINEPIIDINSNNTNENEEEVIDVPENEN